MRVVVNYDLCEGHGECELAAPDVFALGDDDEQVTVLQAEPDESLRRDVERAVALCPKSALRLEG
jgi:ferredoxin